MNETSSGYLNKWFSFIFITILTLSVCSSFYRYIILEDYEVFVEYDEEGNLIDIETLEE